MSVREWHAKPRAVSSAGVAIYGSRLRISRSHAHIVLRSSFHFSLWILEPKRDCSHSTTCIADQLDHSSFYFCWFVNFNRQRTTADTGCVRRWQLKLSAPCVSISVVFNWLRNITPTKRWKRKISDCKWTYRRSYFWTAAKDVKTWLIIVAKCTVFNSCKIFWLKIHSWLSWAYNCDDYWCLPTSFC